MKLAALPLSLSGRHFLKLQDLSAAEIQHLVTLAAKLKSERRLGTEKPTLNGKVIALIFEKDSTRTRCAFEVGARHQGAQTSYLGPNGTHFMGKETVADTAKVLGGMYDAIVYRGHGQQIVEELAQHTGVPVYNGLTDDFHPTQILADFLTMKEHCRKPLYRQTLTYLGDGANNMVNSLMVGCAKIGVDLRIASPLDIRPCPNLVEQCRTLGAESGAEISFYEDPEEAVRGCDFLYTDVWLSMGQSADEWEHKVQQLMPFRVDSAVLAASGNPHTKVLHCLPAFHDAKTALGAKFKEEFGLDGIEISDDVFQSKNSVVFEQSENRLHTIKAIMVATLG